MSEQNIGEILNRNNFDLRSAGTHRYKRGDYHFWFYRYTEKQGISDGMPDEKITWSLKNGAVNMLLREINSDDPMTAIASVMSDILASYGLHPDPYITIGDNSLVVQGTENALRLSLTLDENRKIRGIAVFEPVGFQSPLSSS